MARLVPASRSEFPIERATTLDGMTTCASKSVATSSAEASYSIPSHPQSQRLAGISETDKSAWRVAHERKEVPLRDILTDQHHRDRGGP